MSTTDDENRVEVDEEIFSDSLVAREKSGFRRTTLDEWLYNSVPVVCAFLAPTISPSIWIWASEGTTEFGAGS